ncbi:DUF2218 domain-containing protein [Vibrio sp. ZSDE26]|uniref:DUF2218 domain-containing protein n=1 Tax=Vibrio amylolyticus TaxID=2847292 RepID=A0A9X1XMV7_9VIBR|nr:DUF2218 domain-containing protein [Vibrio amylolyticus]MCK6265847.1 DUF2218 domain-containing protein [Vibrio amylolyticus]
MTMENSTDSVQQSVSLLDCDELRFVAKATIQSQHASNYITVLCRHFARKVDAKWDETNGIVNFPVGVTSMNANVEENELTFVCASMSAEQLEHQKSIISQHMDTYSRREQLDIKWRAV